ncbi:MAG: chemotaxis protein CheW [Actinobacteria bacterium]|nr:chemotaxis protein CheW [Actinomycetota bacterium]
MGQPTAAAAEPVRDTADQLDCQDFDVAADDQILQSRAEALAELVSDDSSAETTEMLFFELLGVRFGIRLSEVHEVIPTQQYAEIPGAPSWVAGVTHCQGSIVVLVDAKQFLGITGAGIADRRHLLVIGGRIPEFGILVDRAHEVRSVATSDLVVAEGAATSNSAPSVSSMLPDATQIVDAERLLSTLSAAFGALAPTAQSTLSEVN